MTDAITIEPRRKFSAGRLWLQVMAAASVALSVGSGIETYLGLLEFSPPGVLGWFISSILTFGVQALLLVISWMLAENLREVSSRLWWMLGGWLLCALISGYFSFYGFFDGLGGRNEDLRRQVVQSQAIQILQEIDKTLESELAEAHDLVFLPPAPAQPPSAYQTWKAGPLLQILQVAGSSKQEIERAVREGREKIFAQIQQLKDTKVEPERKRRDEEIRLREARAFAERLREDVETLRNRIAEIDSALSANTGAIEGLKASLSSELRTGLGPRARETQANIVTAEAEQDRLLTELAAAQSSLDQRETDLARINQERASGIEEQRINELDAELGRIETEISTLNAKLETASTTSDFDFSAASQAIDTALASLEARRYEGYDDALARCASIRAKLAASTMAERIEGVSCESGEVTRAVDALKAQASARVAFTVECVEGAPRMEPARETGAQIRVDPMLDHLALCSERVSGFEQQAAIGDRITALRATRGDKASPITSASIALFSDLQSNAVLAAFFAVTIDLLVLIAAIVGRNFGLSSKVRGIDYIIRHRRGSGQEDWPFIVTMPPRGSERNSVEEVADMLRRELLAENVDGEGSTLRLRPSAIQRLRAERAREVEDTASLFPAPRAQETERRARAPIRRI